MDPPCVATGLNSDIHSLFCPLSEILPKAILISGNLFILYLLPASIENIHITALAGDIKSDVIHGGHLLVEIRIHDQRLALSKGFSFIHSIYYQTSFNKLKL